VIDALRRTLWFFAMCRASTRANWATAWDETNDPRPVDQS